MTASYVILDRDGVINIDSDAFIKSPSEWLPIVGSLEAISLLNQHGVKVVVITNQSGIARGLFDLETLQAIHEKMRGMLDQLGGKIEAIYYCPHGPESLCLCRKPNPGLFNDFAKEKNIDLKNVFAIGDSLRDIEAARLAGAQPILVRTGKGLHTLQTNPQLNLPVFDNLYDAAAYIISES